MKNRDPWGHPSEKLGDTLLWNARSYVEGCPRRIRRVSPYFFIYANLFLLLWSVSDASAERLQHYELPKKVGLAPIVVTGNVVEADDEEALIRIKDILKGELKSGDTIKVENNVEVKPGFLPANYKKGERVVAFLYKHPDPKVEGVYRTYAGVEGKIDAIEQELPLYKEAIEGVLELNKVKVEVKDKVVTENLYITMLKSENFYVKDSALYLIKNDKEIKRMDANLIGAVVPLVDHPDWRIRCDACWLLGAKENREIIPVLLKKLDDEREWVRYAAIIGLNNLTGESLDYDPFSAKEDRVYHIKLWREGFK